MEGYYTAACEASAEITEKKSRFIATVRPVRTESEAAGFIAEMKKKYWDARHNCSAYIVTETVGDGKGPGTYFKDIEKSSDDGEPSKTAGAPILDVIKGNGMKNTAIVVTRYFGGVLLGTGGLVRAYSQATAEGIKASGLVFMRLLNKVRVLTDYNSYGRLGYIARDEGIVIEDTRYTDMVECVCLCDDRAFGILKSRMTEITKGKCDIELLGRDFFRTEEA